MRRAGLGLVFLAIATSVTGCDQVTKLRAIAELRAGERAIEVIEGFGRFVYVENPGASWNILRDAPEVWRGPLLVTVSLLGLAGIVLWLLRSTSLPTAVALGLVFGGALGNLVDRLRLGYVVDFILLHWRDRAHFPVFNVADIAITCGALLLLLGPNGRGAPAALERGPR